MLIHSVLMLTFMSGVHLWTRECVFWLCFRWTDTSPDCCIALRIALCALQFCVRYICDRTLGGPCLSMAETCAELKYFLITPALHFPDRSVNNTWCSTLFSLSRSLTGLSPLRRACLTGLYACGNQLLFLLDGVKCLCQSSA